MLDVRAVAYLSPVAEQPIGPLTPSVSVISFGDEAALITGLFRIYRKSTDQLLYTSEILPTTLAGHATAALSALTPWNPPAPADDDFFVLFGFHAVNDLVPDGIRETLGAFIFDIKTVPMGPVPAGHHTTHERAGMDPVLVEDLGTAEPAATKFLGNDGAGGLEWKTPSVGAAAVETLTTTENDTALRLAPDGTGGVEWSTGGGGGGTPGGSDTHVQFNDGGAFAGDSGLIFAKTTDILTVAGALQAGAAATPYAASGAIRLARYQDIAWRIDNDSTDLFMRSDVNRDLCIGYGGTVKIRLGFVSGGISAAGGSFNGETLLYSGSYSDPGYGIFSPVKILGSCHVSAPSSPFTSNIAGTAASGVDTYGAYFNNSTTVSGGGKKYGLYLPGGDYNYLFGGLGLGTNAATAKLDVNSDIIRLRTAKTPASAGAAGNQGDICWDADYLYVCVATNTWKRAAIATW
jgi:hypothetical protein